MPQPFQTQVSHRRVLAIACLKRRVFGKSG
jgi:hypothetical protein